MTLLSTAHVALDTGHLADHNALAKFHNGFIPATAFGVVGDGTADDTAAIQAALDAVPSNGGIVFLPAGRYKTTATLRIEKDCTTLMGAGVGERLNGSQLTAGSRIEPSTAVTGSVILVQRVANNRPVLACTLRDFAIEGQLRGTALDGILFRSNRGLIDNAAVYRMTGNGIHIKGYNSVEVAPNGWATYETRVLGCQVLSCAAAGLFMENRGEDMHFTNNILAACQDGIRMGEESASQQITACHCYDNTRYGIFFDAGGTRTKVIGCKIEGNDGGGVRLQTTSGQGMSGIQIVGNEFADNFAAVTNTIDDIYIGGDAATGCSGTQIVGNRFENKGGGAASVKARSNVYLANNAAQSTQVSANSFARSSSSLHVGTEYVIDSGNTSQYLKSYVAGNIGMTTMNSGFIRRGTGTINSGATSATITHGLDRTPTAGDIIVTLTENPTNTPGAVWVDTIGATTFAVNCENDPGASNLDFSWRAAL